MESSAPTYVMWAHSSLFCGTLFEPLPPLPTVSPAAGSEPDAPGPTSSAAASPDGSGPQGPLRQGRSTGMPSDYIDLTRPFGADEPLLVCPACVCPLNNCAPGPDDGARRSLLLPNTDFECPGCRASLKIAIIARPDQPIQWTVLEGMKPPQWGQLRYASDLEQAIAAMQERYLTHSSLEGLAEWVRSGGYLPGHTDARRAVRLRSTNKPGECTASRPGWLARGARPSSGGRTRTMCRAGCRMPPSASSWVWRTGVRMAAGCQAAGSPLDSFTSKRRGAAGIAGSRRCGQVPATGRGLSASIAVAISPASVRPATQTSSMRC